MQQRFVMKLSHNNQATVVSVVHIVQIDHTQVFHFIFLECSSVPYPALRHSRFTLVPCLVISVLLDPRGLLIF